MSEKKYNNKNNGTIAPSVDTTPPPKGSYMKGSVPIIWDPS